MLIGPSHEEPLLRRYIILVVFLFPALIALAGSLGKILVRGNGISKKDFYLGQDLTLAAISAGLVNFLDLAKDLKAQENEGVRVFFTAGYTGLTFFLFIVVMVLHQLWERRDNQPGRQAFWLGAVSNSVGLFLLCLFMLLKLRGIV